MELQPFRNGLHLEIIVREFSVHHLPLGTLRTTILSPNLSVKRMNDPNSGLVARGRMILPAVENYVVVAGQRLWKIELQHIVPLIGIEIVDLAKWKGLAAGLLGVGRASFVIVTMT